MRVVILSSLIFLNTLAMLRNASAEEREEDAVVEAPSVAPEDNTTLSAAPPEMPEMEHVFVPASKFGIPLSFTVRGGVSLGAIEAGYLYYITETLKENPGIFDPRMVTGASAGSINALLITMALGTDPQPDPEKSLFYRVWTRLNQKTLLDTDNPATPMGALSSGKALQEAGELVWDDWKEGLDASFEMVLGMSTTRLNPYEVDVAPGLTLQRQAEKFVFIVKGRGKGKPPLITNVVHVKPGLTQPMLPFLDYLESDSEEIVLQKARRNFERLRDVVLASAAFPIGFPPKRIDYCLVRVTDDTQGDACTEPTHSDMFVDGGVFDNNPLRVAHRIAAMGLSRDVDGHLFNLPPEKAESYLYNYLDPEHTSYPALPVIRKKITDTKKENQNGLRDTDKDIDILKLVPRFFGSFVASARAAELYSLVEEYPEVRKHMKLTTTDYPVVSSELSAFFGFFDREFLKFDFFLGMYSARNYVSRVVQKYLADYGEQRIVTAFKNASLPETGNESRPEWAPLQCMRSWYDDDPSLRTACDIRKDNETRRRHGAPDMHGFRILLQLSLDRLYNHCSQLENKETAHLHCNNAMLGKAPPRIVEPRPPVVAEYWKQCRVCPISEKKCRKKDAKKRGCTCKCSGKRGDESSFFYTMRLLSTYGFQFRDLGVPKDNPEGGMMAMRNRFLTLLIAFSDKHGPDRKLIIETMGKPALNFLRYEPPDQIAYLSVWSALELGWSRAFEKVRWLRFAASPFQMKGLLEVFTTKAVAFTPTFGLDFEVLPLSSPLLQARIGVHLGYQISTRGNFTRSSCPEDTDSSATIRCSFPLLRGIAAISIYERVRLHLGVEWSAPWFDPLPPKNNHWVTLVAGLGWQWLSPF